ncbi:hypothetical protein [Paenibacillus pseudetheri]|uniref:hypothetical protein n=1 Tax=Paenibacillus pseudetheri TaxID=2897682 RepID=UPI001F1D2946|nr:hypothetical protein [Paenibacillus pseudetheri]
MTNSDVRLALWSGNNGSQNVVFKDFNGGYIFIFDCAEEVLKMVNEYLLQYFVFDLNG